MTSKNDGEESSRSSIMIQSTIKWDGDDWQRHVNTLLGMRFAPGQYQPIPDRVGGDYGLEGFSFDGTAFQCYAAEEPLDSEALTTKQRDKITRDINKLCNNHLQLAAVLGSVRIHTWVLMVPRYEDKSILAHAAKKAQQVRAKNLPILTDAFHIAVQDDTVFAAQKNALKSGACEKLPVPVSDVLDAEIDVWTAANTKLIDVLDQKLAKLGKSPEVLQQLKARMVKNFLDGQNAIQYLHANYPQVEEEVRQCKQAKERALVTESLFSSDLPETRLKTTLAEYEKGLASEIAGVPQTAVQALTHEAAADWLLRCPLDFST